MPQANSRCELAIARARSLCFQYVSLRLSANCSARPLPSPNTIHSVNIGLVLWFTFVSMMSLLCVALFIGFLKHNADVGHTPGTISSAVGIIVWPVLFQFVGIWNAAFTLTCFHTANRIRRTAQDLEAKPFNCKCLQYRITDGFV